ncbi:hypothetical protein [Winogradskyella immobilis]|uniref:Protoporphyrinogen IX oxidase n=1 Tax=Winogradskyella immobilis TaxID=2816852 RepID=A0ABS8EL45_9FLAO|nr:hypothetical protein [Winogradskyella immobilis]MCC1483290.1 hypothetical protein [Winogradskyella immobilis]MCG0015384.1 hypothetical protein [Winogradskyella immobilis]
MTWFFGFILIMFDRYYISAFNTLKSSFGKHAIRYALYYVNLLEFLVYALIASFFMAFANQMGIITMHITKVITLSVIIFLFVCFKNWIRYNGKRRHVLNAKSKHRTSLQLWKLVMLPVVCILLIVVFSKAI